MINEWQSWRRAELVAKPEVGEESDLGGGAGEGRALLCLSRGVLPILALFPHFPSHWSDGLLKRLLSEAWTETIKSLF